MKHVGEGGPVKELDPMIGYTTVNNVGKGPCREATMPIKCSHCFDIAQSLRSFDMCPALFS